MIISIEELSQKDSENLSDFNESDTNKQDDLKNSRIINNNQLNNIINRRNKSDIIEQKNKMDFQSEGISFHHISLNVKNNQLDEAMTEKKLMPLKSYKESSSEIKSIKSSSSNSIKFKDYIRNPFTVYNIRRNNSSFNKNISESFHNSNKFDETCMICSEQLTKEELINNYLECFHFFCDDCYYEYIKEKVNNNQIDRIKCPFKDCEIKLFNNFIESKLFRDIPLLDKYKKLQKRRQLILDPNVQLCPFPDCESYAIKKDENNYVCCIEKKHKFCFNCLKDWHGKKKCDDKVDKSFEKWRDSYKVKRCPKCKFFIEKNEGCNHITCTNCQYQFCWLCLGEYTYDHFDLGRCSGLQYAECTICSNRIINFLYQFLFVILKGAAFAIASPFALVFYIYYTFLEDCVNSYSNCGRFFYGISGVLSCLSLIMCGLTISSFIFALMLFYWPLQDKIFSIIF